ncbi:hypothetical protein HDU91_006195, partial [Kappamyces sp. JEL0680]
MSAMAMGHRWLLTQTFGSFPAITSNGWLYWYVQSRDLAPVSSANEYLILTGYAITELSIKKKAFVLPGQRCTKMSLTPLNYTLSLHAMTVEKLEFLLPAVFTIGPLDEPNAIMRYARLLAGNQTDGVKHIQDIVT